MESMHLDCLTRLMFPSIVFERECNVLQWFTVNQKKVYSRFSELILCQIQLRLKHNFKIE